MVANFLLIATTISALVYLLQKTKYRFSLLFLCGVMSAIPLYFILGRLVVMLAGDDAGRWYTITVYFSPVAAALAVRYSVFHDDSVTNRS
jgi:uncharacterized membrane protein